MNQNSLIEIGSKANVILRFKSEIEINGKTYAANEPYLFLKECNVVINYTNQDKNISAEKTIMANSSIKPRSVIIGGISFSRKLASLLANYIGTKEYNPTEFKYLTADEDTIYLTDDIDPTHLFVYDSAFEKVEDVIPNYINPEDQYPDSISSVNFKDGQEYLISFSSVGRGTKFDMNKPCIPYMSLEIQGIGNIDKLSKKVVMYFDKVSLNSVIQFTFIQDDMINVPLDFHIIDDKNNYVIFED